MKPRNTEGLETVEPGVQPQNPFFSDRGGAIDAAGRAALRGLDHSLNSGSASGETGNKQEQTKTPEETKTPYQIIEDFFDDSKMTFR